MYLTPVPTTYSGLRMDTSASNVLTSQCINSHSLLNEAIEKLPARRRCPSVKPKRVFVQIVLEMRRANSTLMRPLQPPLQPPLRFPILPMITTGTPKSVRPAQFKQVLPTSSIGGKSFHEIKNCVRIVFHSLYAIFWEWGSQVHIPII